MSIAVSLPQKPHFRVIHGMRHPMAKIAILAVAVVFLMGLILAQIHELKPIPLPIGEWTAKNRDWMRVSSSSIRIGRDNSSYAVLPNNANGRRIFDRNDLAKVHPQRLRILENGDVEYIREASGPSPEYRIVFQLKGKGEEESDSTRSSSW